MTPTAALIVLLVGCGIAVEAGDNIQFPKSSSKATTAAEGLTCTPLPNNQTVCTGKSGQYKKDVEIARNKKKDLAPTDIQTRFFRPPCRGENSCTAFQSSYNPTLLKNSQGQDRYIYQDEDFGFTQSVRVVSCGSGQCGFGRGSCKQLYRDYYLISWDPYTNECNPIIDVFQIPDCCGCDRSYNRPIPPTLQ